MRLTRVSGFIVALAACATIEAAPTEYQVSVQQGYVARPKLGSIALVPFSCPPKLECAEIERELITQLTQRTRLSIVESQIVRELMTQASMKSLDDRESRMIVGEGLGVDAFAFVKIQKAQTEAVSPPDDDKWKQFKREVPVTRANLELRVVARDGTPLAQVSGEANVFNSFKGPASVTTQLFSEMIERVWPRK